MSTRPPTPARPPRPSRFVLLLLAAWALTACEAPPPPHTVIPAPASTELREGEPFRVWIGTRILVDPGDGEAARIGRMLAELVGTGEANTPPVTERGSAAAMAPFADSLLRDGDIPGGAVVLTREGADPSLGDEGYELEVRDDTLVIRAGTGAGLFHGVQTLRQLLPARVEYTAAYARPLPVPPVRIVDAPRFAYRGAMLDVARHFRTVDEVKRFVDLMVPYKLNALHLHLSDDQGWRIEIPGWPALTRVGGSTQVGGGPGGFYTADDYREIVRYAAERYVTVIPEIDVPGHTNAALASYPELNCDGAAPPLYTGRAVGFSALCPGKEVTWEFLEDVIGAVADLTPGPFLHMGGDEVETLTEEEYAAFVERVQGLVRARGKGMVGWDEIALAEVDSTAVIQLWRPLWGREDGELSDSRAEQRDRLREGVRRAMEAGAMFLLSPADRVYLDMKYDTSTVIGLAWASLVDERRAYDWRVEELFGMIPEASILGVEAPLWSETVGSIHDAEYLAFPRLTAVAEIGWTPAGSRDWESFRTRLGAHGERWQAQGVNFRRSPGIDWRER